MGWIIASVLSFIMSGIGVYTLIATDSNENAVVAGVAFLLGLLFFKKYLTRNKEKSGVEKVKAPDKKRDKVKVLSIYTKHQAGLPIGQDVNCTVLYKDDRFTIKGSGNEFNLERNKITDISVKTDVEIQKQYVSSVGGAVAGNLVFGPLGAIVGGRAKKKEIRDIRRYLIITYKNDAELSYISFELLNNSSLYIDSWIRKFKEENELVGNIVEL